MIQDTRAQGENVQAGCSEKDKKERRDVMQKETVGLQIRYKGGLAIAL